MNVRFCEAVTGCGLCGLLVVAALLGGGCSKETAFDTNLLSNGSFEDVDGKGVPAGWTLAPFRGGEGQFAVVTGIDEQTAQDGKRSFEFTADPGTRRFFMLAQEVTVPEGATHVHLTGWMQLQGVQLMKDQHAQCNFLLTFFDHEHHRFQELRIADKRTHLRTGAQLWTKEDQKFRLPKGTRYVQVSCVLGTNGRVWFDNVTLSVPKPIPWEEASTKNFVFHWLPGHPMPEGSQPSQQRIFDAVAARLGVTSDVVIQYYFYPDTTTIRNMLSLKGYDYVSWDDHEFHSINANDNHEVVHFITDPMGRPPRAIAEGTVYWVLDEWNGRPLSDAVGDLVRSNRVPDLRHLLDYNALAMLDPSVANPAAASFIGFIVQRWGTPKLSDLYTALNGANSYAMFAVAFERVYKVSAVDVEAAWHERLQGEYAAGKK